MNILYIYRYSDFSKKEFFFGKFPFSTCRALSGIGPKFSFRVHSLVGYCHVMG